MKPALVTNTLLPPPSDIKAPSTKKDEQELPQQQQSMLEKLLQSSSPRVYSSSTPSTSGSSSGGGSTSLEESSTTTCQYRIVTPPPPPETSAVNNDARSTLETIMMDTSTSSAASSSIMTIRRCTITTAAKDSKSSHDTESPALNDTRSGLATIADAQVLGKDSRSALEAIMHPSPPKRTKKTKKKANPKGRPPKNPRKTSTGTTPPSAGTATKHDKKSTLINHYFATIEPLMPSTSRGVTPPTHLAQDLSLHPPRNDHYPRYSGIDNIFSIDRSQPPTISPRISNPPPIEPLTIPITRATDIKEHSPDKVHIISSIYILYILAIVIFK